jgi:hypothetical protein
MYELHNTYLESISLIILHLEISWYALLSAQPATTKKGFRVVYK